MKSDTLHLVLKYQWYDMIFRGEKTEEYRDISTWQHRIDDNVKFVVFHRGYSSTVMKFKVNEVSIGLGKPEWGAPGDKEVLIIKLGARIRMNWQEILEKMRKEHVAARRKGWSGEKYIIFVPGYTVHANDYSKYGYRSEGNDDVQFVDHILIHTKDNKLGFYATTQCDMLADDWEVCV